MNSARLILAALVLALSLGPCQAASAASPAASTFMQQTPPAATPAASPQAPPQRVMKYTLPPDRYQKARNLARIHFRFALIGFVYGLEVPPLVLGWQVCAGERAWAEWKSPTRVPQTIVFSPLSSLTCDIFEP